MPESLHAVEIARDWLSALESAVSPSGSLDATLSLILADGFLRDVLVFTWDARTLEGHSQISSYLESTLSAANLSNFILLIGPHWEPTLGLNAIGQEQVTTYFDFEGPKILGRGSARLVEDPQEAGKWKALSISLSVSEIKGHEEAGPELGVYDGHASAWEGIRAERKKKIEADPYVLILGAGQTGLNTAARFKQMNIPTLVVEKNPRVGDQWRKRYPTLTLHTTRRHHTMLYANYPDNWPIYTPKEKVADWLEQYAISQDLVVWTSSTILPTPTYDTNTKRWHVVVSRPSTSTQAHSESNGVSANGLHPTAVPAANGNNENLVHLYPAHIVIAVGTVGAPKIPNIPGLPLFQGTVLHGAQFNGGQHYAGKKCLVVGFGNTAADIAQDLYENGVQSVTVVLRSSTCAVDAPTVKIGLDAAFPEHVPLAVSDFKFASFPLALQIREETTEKRIKEKWKIHAAVNEKLRKAGAKTNMGINGAGQHLLIFQQFGGFVLDVGIGNLLADGRVALKQGVQVASYTPRGVVFTDGSSLDVDVVIYGTGYHYSRDALKSVFGEEFIDATKEIWGLDEESEINGAFRPTGKPGFWWTAGDFAVSRWLSKQLALQIKAEELGMISA